jgi:hypothetical protein
MSPSAQKGKQLLRSNNKNRCPTLTAPLLGELIDRIDVYETEGTGRNRTQRVVIHYRFVGYIVLPDNVSVTVEVCGSADPSGAAAEVTFDGDTYLDIACGEKVTVDKTRQKTHFIKLNHTSFVTNLREKLK